MSPCSVWANSPQPGFIQLKPNSGRGNEAYDTALRLIRTDAALVESVLEGLDYLVEFRRTRVIKGFDRERFVQELTGALQQSVDLLNGVKGDGSARPK